MTLTKKDILNIEKRLERYEKVFIKIYKRIEVLENEKKITIKDDDKIYLSIAGLAYTERDK